MTPLTSVRPELVEGLSFLPFDRPKEGQGFDKLSPNGFGFIRDLEVLA